MARHKHFHNFEEILFALEAVCMIFLEHLIAFQELFLLEPCHFGVINVVTVPEDFGITTNIINTEQRLVSRK